MINNRLYAFVQQVSLLFVLLVIAFTSNAQTPVKSSDLKVMTFNLRYGTADDGENSWQFRKKFVSETITNFSPELLGVQEALKFQIDELLKQFPDYGYIGVGRDDGISAGEHSAIFYSKERFIVDSSGTFWFSNTPEVIASKSWGNNITRICSWIRIKDKISGKAFYMFNVHLDHESQPSREKSAELLIKRIKEKSLPIILTGDFNCGDENPAIKSILASGLIDSYRKLNVKRNDEGTYHAFKGNKSGEKIDFIFASKEFLINRAEIIDKNFDGKFPSDHFPVTAIINF